MRGWELICICLYFFPPNKVFRDPLHAYLTTRSEALSVALAPPPLSSSISSAAANATNDTPVLRPGPSLAAAAALAAGSDPAGLISTPVTPAFGVPLADAGGGGGGENTCEASADPAICSEFPYGPWVKLSALHFTRAAPRWFMRSVALGAVRSSVPPSKEELLHVKVCSLIVCSLGLLKSQSAWVFVLMFPAVEIDFCATGSIVSEWKARFVN